MSPPVTIGMGVSEGKEGRVSGTQDTASLPLIPLVPMFGSWSDGFSNGFEGRAGQ